MDTHETKIKAIIDAIGTMNPTDALSILIAATISVIVGVWANHDEQDKVTKKVAQLMADQIAAARWLQSQDRPN